MPDMRSARHGVADAETKADGLFAGQNTQTDTETQFAPSPDECVVESIHVELSERGPKRGDCTPVAACSIAKVEGTAAPICSLARELLRLGIGPNTPLSIWRGKTKCFDDAPVGRWAELVVDEGGTGPVFRRYRPFPGRAVASQGAKSDG